jgi:Xaa-Pro aminopeptidase
MPPFNSEHLDRLMEEAGLDALIVTSKHNVQYLLGGHRFFFFDYMDAIGVSRYLPVFVYVRGDLDNARYIANVMEAWQLDVDPVWVGQVETSTWGARDAIDAAIAHLGRVFGRTATVGIEGSFLPVEAFLPLTAASHIELADAQFVLERLRARKSPAEIRLLEASSRGIVDSMKAVFDTHGAGTTKRELVEALRQEQTARGMLFEYCLVSAGPSFNRAPSDQRWEEGDVLCLDSGGNLSGYIGDLARMAVLGEPDSELQDALASIEEIQQAARQPIKPGTIGQEIFIEAKKLLDRSEHKPYTVFLAHGMGLVSHEAPRLTNTGAVPYPNEDGGRPLEEGMVLSIETTMLHPRRGFIKLEDTVIVTETGYRALGDEARGWNAGGRLLHELDPIAN